MMCLRSVWLILGLIAMSCVSCDRERMLAPGGGHLDLAQVEEDLSNQLVFLQELHALAAAMDTTAALDSLVVLIQNDPGVLWAANVRTGVNVEYKTGLRGFLVLRLGGRELPTAAPGLTPGPSSRVSIPSTANLSGEAERNSLYTVPKHRRTIYLAAAFSEFRTWDQSVIDAANAALPQIGYEPFTVLKDEQVTLAALSTVSSGDYGIVRISSHGSPWPGNEKIEEVYLLTGEFSTPYADSVNAAYLQNGTVGVTSYFGQNLYSVNARFFSDHNDFQDGQPLILLGFCFGYLGEWPNRLRTVSKAGAAVGWDWEVIAHREAGRTEWLLEQLCDSSRVDPMTIQRWHAGIDPGYEYGDRTVSIHYSAADSFALWASSTHRITEIGPYQGQPGEEIWIAGSGFGATPGSVRFGATPASTLLSWRDTEIHAVVPEGLAVGWTPVTVIVGGRTSNAAKFFVEDDFFDRIHGNGYVELYFKAWHTFEPWDAGRKTTFSHWLQPLIWNGDAFSGELREVQEDLRRRLTFSGKVDGARRTVSAEYVYADSVLSSHGWILEHKRARFVDVPFENYYGSAVVFSAEGEAVEQHVQGPLEWHRHDFDQNGNPREGTYVTTHWEWSPEDNRLNLGFRVP